MTALNQSTRRRLQQLPQIASVWEGDRRPLLRGMQASLDLVEDGKETEQAGECILWVDGSQGIVRAMDVVAADIGHEAAVRTLLRAMEYPHSPGFPARPQKIVLRDRELLFFLRGVLQELDITLDYVPDLPLIDEIFRSFQEAISTRPPQLPPQYAEALLEKAMNIWQVAPWNVLADHQILELEVNRWDVSTLYASIMGMLGMEYGMLFYRSLDSLKRFRQRVMNQDSMQAMEEAFLGQDCLFITYDSDREEGEATPSLASLPDSAIHPSFGNLHPLEGLRSFLYAEEAATLLAALESLQRFLRQHQRKFANDAFPAITSRYRINNPVAEEEEDKAQLSIKVSSMPELAAELLEMSSMDDDQEDTQDPIIRDDLVPENSFLSLGVVPWDMLDFLRSGTEYYQAQEVTQAGDGLPVVMIQTSRPKAKILIKELQAAGGLTAICFNPGEDPYGGDRYDLGLLQTGNGDLHLFGEFGEDDPTHLAARKKWDQRCKKTKGVCGLIIAKGLTGANRGNPQFPDMMGLFEAHALSPKELGLGILQLRLAVDWL
jgi:hypothetical protein